MIQRALEQITKEDIESLVNAKVSEKRTLDYKQQWPDNSSESKREFLYDVSSFANALGRLEGLGQTERFLASAHRQAGSSRK